MTPYFPNTYDILVGIDVDKKSYSFTVKDEHSMMSSKKIPANAEQFYNYMQNNYPGKKILYAYEAGPTGYYLYDYLKSKGCICLVISPNSIPKAPNERVKNNRIDSQKLVWHLQSSDLQPIRIPEGPYRELRHLVKIREEYTELRKITKQRIKAFLLFANLHTYVKDADKNWSCRYIELLKKIPCSTAERIKLDMEIETLIYVRKQLLSIHREIKNFVKTHPDIQKYVEYLMSIPGIGFIVATSILGKIGDPCELKNVREIACFIGFVPSEKSTGDVVNRGPISHFGDKELRRLLIEAAWIAIRRDKELAQFYYRIYKRNHPKGASQKAITAVARKLTTRIYCVLKSKRMYKIH